ncbi:sensor histidine kinase [Azohydromonas aeria]|uniref:sensor histidine kinase n=1 Tax=Azohydromonas aeria TaxID=2590212 RepID=UPI0012FC2EF4|nr:histidine kinase [Azohydromonas aeria]
MQAFHASPGATMAVQMPATPLPPLPMELPRLVMRRALAVALGALALCLVLGLLRMREDTQREMEGSLALARAGATLATIATQDHAAALAALRSLPGLRHMRLSVRDTQGRILLGPEDAAAPQRAGAWARLAALLGLPAPTPAVSWTVPRPDGLPWTVELAASPDSELHEALSNLAGTFTLLALCCLLMLAVMRWNVRRSLRPLQALLGAIARVERRDMASMHALPPMPIRELEAIARALKHLVAEQERSEDARRLLSLRLLSLREDERQRLARDLHDEFGQRLTALRVDAAWLTRRLQEQPALQGVAAGMGEQVAQVQEDVRKLLARLRPFDTACPDSAEPTLGRLRQMLQELVAGWSAAAHGHGPHIELAITTADDTLALPQEMVLGLYRMSQEALTNVARHAGAQHVRLALHVEDGGGQALRLQWSVQDDGCGLDNLEAAMQRGSGLAGIKERVWALGGEFDWGTADTSHAAGGLRLRACFAVESHPQEAQP